MVDPHLSPSGNPRLQGTLSEALASRVNSSSKSKFSSDSPANLAIRLLDNLILGEDVSLAF